MKTALITGASSGIGLELASIFAENGFHLVLVARSESALQNIAKELERKYSIRAIVIAKDLSLSTSADEIFSELTALQIKVDVLVNNAGFGVYGPFTETEWKNEKSLIDLNITSLVHLTKLFLPSMKMNRQGKIINIASTAAFQPGPLMSLYYASKAFVLSFSEAIAEELLDTGVSVTTVCPGPTATGFQKAAKMERSRLFRLKVDSAEFVARKAYEGAMRNKRIVITGWTNRVLANLVRFLPRRLVTKAVKIVQGKR